MICTKCGKEIADNLNYCPYCGNRVDADVAVENSEIIDNRNLEQNNTTIDKEEEKTFDVPAFHKFNLADIDNNSIEDKKEEIKEEIKEIKTKKKSYAWLLSLFGYLLETIAAALPWLKGESSLLLIDLLMDSKQATVFGLDTFDLPFSLSFVYVLLIIVFGLLGIVFSAGRMKKITAFFSIINFLIEGILTIYIIVYAILKGHIALIGYGLYIALVGILITFYSSVIFIKHYKDRA